MPIIAKRTERSFIPCPAGLHPAVCVDVVDLGVLKVTFSNETKVQHKCKIVWQTADEMPDGKPFLVQRRYTLSLSEKSSLRKDLESWRGKPFTDEELDGFDLEKLIGANCQLNVVHDQKNGDTYANVTTVVPLGRGMVKIKPRDYIRVQDRDPRDGAAKTEITDEDIPF